MIPEYVMANLACPQNIMTLIDLAIQTSRLTWPILQSKLGKLWANAH